MIPQYQTIDFENTAVAFAHQTDMKLRKAYWMFKIMNKTWLVKTGSFLTRKALQLGLPVKPLIRHTIFQHFCGGETIRQCHETIHTLSAKGVGTILDYSVEGEETEISFDKTLDELIATVEEASKSTDIPFAVFKVTGISRAALLEKVQANIPFTKPEKEELGRAKKRILTLCQKASDCRVKIFFDAEESWIQDTIDNFCEEMMSRFNQNEAIVYNTYQFYRRNMLANYQKAYQDAAKNQYFLGAKLVRGAYMEKEALTAARQNKQTPIHSDKSATDHDYNEAIRFSLDHISQISICVATHNEYSCQLCANEMVSRKISKNDPRIYFAQLLGMSDNISFNMALAGYNVAKYVPFGPIRAVMPYLFRRANENTAIAGQSSREFLLITKELKRRQSHKN